MDRLVFYLFLIFKLIVQLSIFSIIPIISIIIINKILNKKISIKFQYILYIFILFRMIFPIMPKSSLSLYNNINLWTIPNNKYAILDMMAGNDNLDGYNSSLNYYREIEDSLKTPQYISFSYGIKKFDFYTQYFFILWCIGAVILAIYNVLLCVRFHKRLKFGIRINENKIEGLVIECSKILKINSRFKLLELNFISSPAVFGIKNPIILIPKGFLTNIKEEDLKNILLHELCHYKRKDIFILYLYKVIFILYWFNPLIWYAIYNLKKTLELSCDEMALSYMDLEERIRYGYTIINAASYSKNSIKPSMALNIVENKKDIANRIKFIRDFKKKSLFVTAVSLIGVILIGTVMLTESNRRVSEDVDRDISYSYIVDTQGKIRKINNVDMSFKIDNSVLGKWIAVDFVRDIEKFNPSKRNWNEEDLYLKQLEFFQNGTTSVDYENFRTIYEKWTKDFVLNPREKIASKYYIRNIKGNKYMFFQWKNGDYAFRDKEPFYYVLKKVKVMF